MMCNLWRLSSQWWVSIAYRRDLLCKELQSPLRPLIASRGSVSTTASPVPIIDRQFHHPIFLDCHLLSIPRRGHVHRENDSHISSCLLCREEACKEVEGEEVVPHLMLEPICCGLPLPGDDARQTTRRLDDETIDTIGVVVKEGPGDTPNRPGAVEVQTATVHTNLLQSRNRANQAVSEGLTIDHRRRGENQGGLPFC